ncbi:MAG: hypothetical protein EPN97_13295 [Alphaproteobacteria bacterium]|nr:MAG: hypothetical protein EPN97_13295 [Alphaproteobacteria bacterium]
MKFIKDGFKSLYRSGTEFTEKILPKFLRKIGVPEKAANVIGKSAGSFAGVASLVTGAYFLIAIPVSMPMFLVASGMLPVKGSIAAVVATALLGSTGTVVTTTGLGMCRAAAKGIRNTFKAARRHLLKTPSPVPAATEKSSFRVTAKPAAAFKNAATAVPEAPQTQPQSAPPAPGMTPGA